MMKMEIKMNEEKINREKKYRLQGMYKRLDDGFADLGMLKVEDGSDTLMYYGINEAKDFANFGRMVLALKREEWFMDNVVVWRLYESDDTVDPDDFAVNDLVEYYRKKGLIRR